MGKVGDANRLPRPTPPFHNRPNKKAHRRSTNPTMEFPALKADFEQDCRTRNMTHEFIRRYISAIRILYFFCEKARINIMEIENDSLLKFLTYLREERKNSPKTVQNVFNSLSTFYGFLEYTGRIQKNPIPPIRTRYVRSYKSDRPRTERRLLSVEEMARLICITLNIRDQAMLMLFAKTGIRRNELISLDIDDVDLPGGEIILKPTAKRSNRLALFDDECAAALLKWLELRRALRPTSQALFTNVNGNRVDRSVVYDTVIRWATLAGFHDPESKRSEKRFGPHCFRHWFTTWLIRNGMPRDYIKELRGDARREAIDIYNHIDKADLKRRYLATIPKIMPNA